MAYAPGAEVKMEVPFTLTGATGMEGVHSAWFKIIDCTCTVTDPESDEEIGKVSGCVGGCIQVYDKARGEWWTLGPDVLWHTFQAARAQANEIEIEKAKKDPTERTRWSKKKDKRREQRETERARKNWKKRPVAKPKKRKKKTKKTKKTKKISRKPTSTVLHPVPKHEQKWPPKNEHEDECAMCSSMPEGNQEPLRHCSQCHRLTCNTCQDDKGRCGFCAGYDLPMNFISIDSNVGYPLKAEWTSMGGRTLNDLPKPHTFWYDDPNLSPVVEVSSLVWPGIGIHYHTDIEAEGQWLQIGRDAPAQWHITNLKPKTPQSAKRWIKEQLIKHYGTEQRVFVIFKSSQVRRWFYKEGD
jgi:hypothetical protein